MLVQMCIAWFRTHSCIPMHVKSSNLTYCSSPSTASMWLNVHNTDWI